jgi:sulfite exporter TauE/SafE
MMDWIMLVVGGLLGSSHCVGMCGGFALTLASNARGLSANLVRQFVYCLGRVFTYSAGGALVGYAGWRLTNLLPSFVHFQAILCIVAGVLLIVQGLDSTGIFRRFQRGGNSQGCLVPSMFAAVLSATRMHNVFLGGVINGLLPCGLVYAFLSLAASSGDMLRGSATMALFGLGTIPAMMAVGVGGSFLSRALRSRVLKWAAWCVVLTGVISVFRGIGFIHYEGLLQPPSCPFCE